MANTPGATRGISLGRIRSARVVVQPSTLIMLVLLAFLFSSSAVGGVTQRAFSLGLLMAVLLFVSVFLHELAHAIAAWSFRREVKEIVLTLWGGHTTFDSRGMTPLVSGVTAIAGPVANGVIAVLCWTVAGAHVLEGTAQNLLEWVVIANILLAAFNLLPGIPMDGGRVLESIVWAATDNRNRATIVAAWTGRVIAVGVLVGSLALPVLLLSRSPGIYDLLFGVLIFSVLWPAANTALKVARSLQRRENTTAGSLMVVAVGVPYSASVADAVAAAERAGAAEVVVQAADGAPAGHFPLATAAAVPAELRSSTGLQAVTSPIPRGAIVAPWIEGDELVEQLRRWHGATDVWVVVENDRVVGVVPLAAVFSALQ